MASPKSQANPYLRITELLMLWLAIYPKKYAYHWNRTLHLSVQMHWQRSKETFPQSKLNLQTLASHFITHIQSTKRKPHILRVNMGALLPVYQHRKHEIIVQHHFVGWTQSENTSMSPDSKIKETSARYKKQRAEGRVEHHVTLDLRFAREQPCCQEV